MLRQIARLLSPHRVSPLAAQRSQHSRGVSASLGITLGLSLIAAGCRTPQSSQVADAGSAAVSSGGGCGSPLGAAVLAAATAGDAAIPPPYVSYANQVIKGPIIDGQAIGDALYSLIASAKSEVFIQMFDLDERSWLATRVRDGVAALPAGVTVRILGNGSSIRSPGLAWTHIPETSAQYSQRIATLLNRPGGAYAMWDPGIDPRRLLHNKVIIVDGAEAMMLDANLQPNADPAGSSPGALAWHQQAVIIGGEVAATLRRDFVDAWQHGKPTASLPPAPPVQPAPGCLAMVVLTRNAGATENAAANLGYAALMRGATKTLRVITPNLNDAGAMAALGDATATADVNLVISQGFNEWTEKLPLQGGANDQTVKTLAQIATNPCHLHVRWYAHDPGVAINGNGLHASHAKWAAADDSAMITGSQNLDTQSWTQSRELGVLIDDKATTQAFNAAFDPVFQRGAVAFECPTPG